MIRSFDMYVEYDGMHNLLCMHLPLYELLCTMKIKIQLEFVSPLLNRNQLHYH